MENYKLINEKGEVIISDIDDSFYVLIDDIKFIHGLISNQKYTKAEEVKKQLIEKLNDIV
jgi:predicted regulator of Ras-like GTPase activity (Roadblock/LC7/MglB family)